MRVDFTSQIEHKSLEKSKKRIEKMLSLLDGFEYKLSSEGAIISYKGKKYFIPYKTLYEKSISSKKSDQDIKYNLDVRKFYKEVSDESVKEITFSELVFLYLNKMKFLPELSEVIKLVESIEESQKDLGVEAILDFGKLRFIFRYGSKVLVDLSYETLRDRYLENEERVENLKKNISLKARRAIDKEKKKHTLTQKSIEVRNIAYSFLEENGMKLVDPNFQSIKQKVSIICSCGRTFDYYLHVLLQYKVPSCPECRKTKSSLESFFEENIVYHIPKNFEFIKKVD
jgi:hypothetical protein